jgi:uncharacterized cupredoxin-like copper-binding protein
MKRPVLSVLFASILTVPGALADQGHSHGDTFAYGQPGDANKPARTITVMMKETDGAMLFEPDHIEIRKGEQIRFSMKNHGESDHEFVLGTHDEIVAHAEQMKKNPDMEHDDPNSKRLAAKENGDIVWLFNKPGRFEFACLIPGHMEAGMKGTIVVR